MSKGNKRMEKKRIITVDLARMIAIFCVILTHAVESVWQMDVNSLLARKYYINLVILGLHTIGRLVCVIVRISFA